jgi:hypothetical protein
MGGSHNTPHVIARRVWFAYPRRRFRGRVESLCVHGPRYCLERLSSLTRPNTRAQHSLTGLGRSRIDMPYPPPDLNLAAYNCENPYRRPRLPPSTRDQRTEILHELARRHYAPATSALAHQVELLNRLWVDKQLIFGSPTIEGNDFCLASVALVARELGWPHAFAMWVVLDPRRAIKSVSALIEHMPLMRTC